MTLKPMFTGVILAGGLIFAAELIPSHEGVVAHEWGTFTSVAGQNGDPVEWAALSGTPDLPCFVDRLGELQVKFVSPATIRMETPVLYFYSPRDTDVSVHVRFPEGLITEWYPKATHASPAQTGGPLRYGEVTWNPIHLSTAPGASTGFPTGKGPSRYYAARNTDSAALTINDQHEKMIFYRGVGKFPIPIHAQYSADGTLDLRNTGEESIPMAIVFENRDGHIGYRVLHDFKDSTTVPTPEFTGNVGALRLQLTTQLVASGLYPKEAAAMLETWHDSWFENGARVIYILPPAMVDRVLPLDIKPAPTSTARVYVGRAELFSPWLRKAAETALANGDDTTLAKSGRFLPTLSMQIGRTNPELIKSSSAHAAMNKAYAQIYPSSNKRCIE